MNIPNWHSGALCLADEISRVVFLGGRSCRSGESRKLYSNLHRLHPGRHLGMHLEYLGISPTIFHLFVQKCVPLSSQTITETSFEVSSPTVHGGP